MIKQYGIYLADLNPRKGTEPGKVRPVVVVQSNTLNRAGFPSTIICPITTNVDKNKQLLRIHLNEKKSGLDKASDIVVDQIRAIDNRRFLSPEPIAELTISERAQLIESLRLILLS